MAYSSLALVGAVVSGALLGSLADWLFAGLLFHGRYQRYPEVWREGAEGGRILAAQALSVLTAAAMVLLAAALGETNVMAATRLAIAIWLIGPLPMLLANHLFIKIDPMVTASHAVGWLVKLLLVAGAIALFLG